MIAETNTSADHPLGGWEWIAFPELGIACMKARLAPEADVSLLAVADHVRIELDGAAGMRFRIYPLPGDERTFLLAEAPLAKVATGHRGPQIRTLMTLGEATWPVELELVPRSGGGPALTLGRRALCACLAVDPAAGATAGPPRIWSEPHDGAAGS